MVPGHERGVGGRDDFDRDGWSVHDDGLRRSCVGWVRRWCAGPRGLGDDWWLKERADRRREIRTDQRALRDARAERLRAAYMTVLLSVRALLEVITRQTAPAMLIGEPAPDQLRALIIEMGGAATKEIRAAEFALWLDGEDTELVHQATGAYAVYQLSLALPGVVAQVDANRQISLLNESLEALRMHARKRLEELGTPE